MIGTVIFIILAIVFIFQQLRKRAQARRQQELSALKPQNKSKPLECKLINKTQVSPDSYLFEYSLPQKHQVLGIQVGQHIILNETIQTKDHPEGEIVERKYTPTSRINKTGSFDLLIKIYRANVMPQFPDGGKLTSWIENTQINDTIHITGPFGKLQYEGNGRFFISKPPQTLIRTFDNIVMIAGGSGITPMFQIIQAIAEENNNIKMRLLYANKREEDILLLDQLKKYADMKKLNLFLTLDNPPTNWSYFTGFVTKDMTEKAFNKLNATTLALTCGPPMMNQLAIANFTAMGASVDNIHQF